MTELLSHSKKRLSFKIKHNQYTYKIVIAPLIYMQSANENKIYIRIKKNTGVIYTIRRVGKLFRCTGHFCQPSLPPCNKFMSNAYARKFHEVLNTVDPELFFELFEMVLSADQQQFC